MNRITAERADLFDPNIYITMLFDIIGRADTGALVAAIYRAYTGFEATMSGIALMPDGEAGYVKRTVSGCTVEITQSDWKSVVRENEKMPFSLETGEFMRIFLKPSEEKTAVLIMAHHLAGDGKSIVYFIERIMKEYIGEVNAFQPLHLLTQDALPDESRLPYMIKRWVNKYNRRWNKSGKVFGWYDYYTIHKTYWRKRESVILTESFLPENVERIHKKASVAGVSINSCIITAFLKANQNLRAAGLAVDARIDGNRTMSNQATGITVDYVYKERISFDKNAQEVHKRIYKKLKNPVNRYFILRLMPLFAPSLVDSILMHTHGLYQNRTSEKLSKIMGYTAEGSTSFGITNLTKLDIDNTYESLRIKNLYFIPPAVSYSRQTIGVATTESGMTVTCHCMSDTFDENKEILFENAMKILLRLGTD